jgi:hypothetical protein
MSQTPQSIQFLYIPSCTRKSEYLAFTTAAKPALSLAGDAYDKIPTCLSTASYRSVICFVKSKFVQKESSEHHQLDLKDTSCGCEKSKCEAHLSSLKYQSDKDISAQTNQIKQKTARLRLQKNENKK